MEQQPVQSQYCMGGGQDDQLESHLRISTATSARESKVHVQILTKADVEGDVASHNTVLGQSEQTVHYACISSAMVPAIFGKKNGILMDGSQRKAKYMAQNAMHQGGTANYKKRIMKTKEEAAHVTTPPGSQYVLCRWKRYAAAARAPKYRNMMDDLRLML